MTLNTVYYIILNSFPLLQGLVMKKSWAIPDILLAFKYLMNFRPAAEYTPAGARDCGHFQYNSAVAAEL